jgi:uncharacterized protein (TIGR03382 family)
MCIAGTSVSCGPYVCKDAKTCLAACDAPAQCVAGAWCNKAGGKCETKLPNGAQCTVAESCASGLCIEQVCCNAACTAPCESCAAKGSEGTCVPVTQVPAGKPPCQGTDAICAGKCDGKSNSCVYAAAGVSCAEPGCTQGASHVSSCNGQGECVLGQPTSCGAYACGQGTCRLSCASDTECASGYVCNKEGKCVPSANATCSSDLTQSIGAKGAVPCTPFLCEAAQGTCRVVCSASTDCAQGYVCDTMAKSCVPAAAGGATDTGDSGGCSTAGAGSSGSALAWLALSLLAARTRRRS